MSTFRPRTSCDDATVVCVTSGAAVRSSFRSSRPQCRRRRRTASLPSPSRRKQGNSDEEEEGLVSCLKRLRVTPLTEAQKARQRQQKQREFRNRIRMALSSGGASSSSSASSRAVGVATAASARESLLVPSRLFGSQVLAPCQPDPARRRRLQRARHASDSGGEQHRPQQEEFPSQGLQSRCGHFARSLTEVSSCCKELELFSLKGSHPHHHQHPTATAVEVFQSDSFTRMQHRRNSGEGEEEGDEEVVDSLAHELSSSTSVTAAPPSSSASSSSVPISQQLRKPSRSSCAQQAKDYLDVSVNDLAGYLEDSVVFPKKMSRMAEMMYT